MFLAMVFYYKSRNPKAPIYVLIHPEEASTGIHQRAKTKNKEIRTSPEFIQRTGK